MKYVILFLIIVNSSSGIAQNKSIRLNFLNADSVVLVSHKLTARSTDNAVDINGNNIPFSELIISNRVNKKIIIEKRIIKGLQLNYLIQILTRPFKGITSSQGGCFLPHHAILVIKNGTTSYIDICFHCGSFETSEDLKNIEPFDEQRWSELEKYFRRLGFKYELKMQLN